jgi:hypothetical protein
MRFPWSRDLRLKASSQEALGFIDGREGRYAIHEVCNYLIYDNPAISDPDADWKRLSKGQKALIRISVFDAQIRNGGVEQYLWNYPHEVFEVQEALELIKAEEVARQYESVLDQLCEASETWIDLRASFTGPTESDLEAALDAAELIDGDEFNSAYYGEWDGWGKQLEPGLDVLVYSCFVGYFKGHQREFIKTK